MASGPIDAWPEDVRGFWESNEPERFGLAGPDGDRLDFMRHTPQGVDVYARDLAGIHMQELSTKLRQAREVVARSKHAICAAASR
jgi:hypothetical protein